MKVIFLDFDGVLNTAELIHSVVSSRKFTSYTEKHYEELDPVRVKMISDLALETGAVIVVSSSWRILHTLEELRDMLRCAGMDERVLPIDVTPNTSRGFRGQEVYDWLSDHPDVTHHVIFDDDGDFYPLQPLVKTSWEGGLTEDHIDLARGALINNNAVEN
jgi:hypothetical protein